MTSRPGERVQGGGRVGPPVVTPSAVVLGLGAAMALLAGLAAAVGLFAHGGPGPHEVVSARGQATDLYGTGLYRADSWLNGAGNRGTDAVTLFVEVPALVAALLLHRRASLRGTLVLLGVLGWLGYYYASMSLGAAWNRLFVVHLALFALAVVTLPLVWRTVDPLRLAAVFPRRPSTRVLVGYLVALALLITLVWAPAMVVASVTGDVPARLGTYATEVTWALDLAVVVPAVLTSAVLLRRGAVTGPLAVSAMLALNVALGLALVGQGVAQLVAGVPVSGGEVVGAMVSFAVMTAVAGLLLVRLLRGLREGE